MKINRIALSVLLLSMAANAVVTHSSSANAQSGSSTRKQQPTAKQPFERRLWNYLVEQRYRNWAPAPGQNGGHYEGQSPHGAYLKMYLNRVAVSSPKNLPYRSIIIKENYGADRQTLMAVTVMYRIKGYDPEHNDWYWAKYNPDGTVALAPPEKGNVRLAGRVGGCIECHSGSADKDFVFFNE